MGRASTGRGVDAPRTLGTDLPDLELRLRGQRGDAGGVRWRDRPEHLCPVHQSERRGAFGEDPPPGGCRGGALPGYRHGCRVRDVRSAALERGSHSGVPVALRIDPHDPHQDSASVWDHVYIRRRRGPRFVARRDSREHPDDLRGDPHESGSGSGGPRVAGKN